MNLVEKVARALWEAGPGQDATDYNDIDVESKSYVREEAIAAIAVVLEEAARVIVDWGAEHGGSLMPMDAAAWHIEKAVRRALNPKER